MVGVFFVTSVLQKATVLLCIHLNTRKWNVCSIRLKMIVLRLHNKYPGLEYFIAFGKLVCCT